MFRAIPLDPDHQIFQIAAEQVGGGHHFDRPLLVAVDQRDALAVHGDAPRRHVGQPVDFAGAGRGQPVQAGGVEAGQHGAAEPVGGAEMNRRAPGRAQQAQHRAVGIGAGGLLPGKRAAPLRPLGDGEIARAIDHGDRAAGLVDRQRRQGGRLADLERRQLGVQGGVVDGRSSGFCAGWCSGQGRRDRDADHDANDTERPEQGGNRTVRFGVGVAGRRKHDRHPRHAVFAIAT
jgi:hypothetical protein